MTSNEKQSPLRRPPLRQAGQSLHEQAQDLWEDKNQWYLLTALLLVFLAFFEWWNWFFKLPPLPWVMTALAVVYIGYAAIRVRPLYQRHSQLRLGRDGERTVGQELEKLREHGYRVYHDFLGEKGNIDHIVIGPTGVFTIETKSFSRPKNPDAKIVYDGKVVTVPGCKLDRDPIAQAKAERDEIRNLIQKYANRDAPVRPAVVFVGWYTERQPEGAEVWVLNTKGVVSFIQHERSKLSEDDIAHISGILEEHILKKQRDLYDKRSPSWMT
jgi:hypothetical protein